MQREIKGICPTGLIQPITESGTEHRNRYTTMGEASPTTNHYDLFYSAVIECSLHMTRKTCISETFLYDF